MVKAGKFVIPGGSTFSVTGLGFKPQWVIFLFSNYSTEDVWTSGPSAGIGWSAMQNNVLNNTGTLIRTGQISEIWQGSGVAGSFLGDVTSWIRATRGSDGWALYTSSLDADGFTFNFSGGFNSGAGGQIAYYLAGDEGYDQVGSRTAFVPGSAFYNLGWEPYAFFGVGAGGGVGGDGGTQSFSLFDQSVPSAAFGDWGEYNPEGAGHRALSTQWRGILDPNVDVQEWWGYEDNTSSYGTILEPTQSVGAQFQSGFHHDKTATSFKINVFAIAGFSDGAARMHGFALGNVDSVISSFVPNPTVGVPTAIDLPFTPEAVVFFSPQDFRAGVFGTDTQGATGWGFCTPDDQALLIYGGFYNPPNPFQSNGLISSQNCWVSNAIDTPQAVGSNVAKGSARCTTTGFEYTTTENNAPALYPILYWAFAPKAPGAGFFEILG